MAELAGRSGLRVDNSFKYRGRLTWCIVLAADGLSKRDVFSEFETNGTFPNATGLPDPFAVVTVDGEQTQTTPSIKRTLNPYWNESFELYVSGVLAELIM
jgi:hypothetical protein